MFFSPQEDPHILQVIKFYCGSTCLYFPLLTILILCTDLMFKTGKFSFLPYLGLIALSEYIKSIFINYYIREPEKLTGRNTAKLSGTGIRKWFSEKKLKDGSKVLVLLGLVTVGYFAIAILFGAELFSKYEETLMLSLMLVLLTALPPCLYLGPNFALGAILGDEPSSLNPLSPIFQHVVRITLLGVWLGAFVIPLDWDRPWQEWPVPCCVGALMGYVAAHASALIQVALPRCLTQGITSKIKQ